MDIGFEVLKWPEFVFTIDGRVIEGVQGFRIRDKPFSEGGGKEVTLILEPDTFNGRATQGRA